MAIEYLDRCLFSFIDTSGTQPNLVAATTCFVVELGFSARNSKSLMPVICVAGMVFCIFLRSVAHIPGITVYFITFSIS